jgi:hypothetical protein
MRHPRRTPAAALLLAALLAGCGGGGGVEGKYYNQADQFVLELKGGKVTMAPGGMQMMNATYEVRGDSIIIKDPSNGQEAAALVRQKDGSIDAGMMGTLKKK